MKIFGSFSKLIFGKREEVIRNCNVNSNQTFTSSNRVKTTKYTIYNFIFKNSLEQLRVPSCMYFVFIAILQAIPQMSNELNSYEVPQGNFSGMIRDVYKSSNVSSTHGIPVILLPLFIVTLGTALRDAYEDYQRYLSDNEVNNKLAQVLNVPGVTYVPKKKASTVTTPHTNKNPLESELLITKYWKDLKVGEVVILQNGGIIPADMVIFGTSEENGVCFVDTSCLDGETNVKKKESIPLVFQRLTRDVDVALSEVKHIYGRIICDPPNKNLMRYDGVLKYNFDEQDVGGKYSDEDIERMIKNDEFKHYDISLINLLLRGCILRNTKWALGVIVYTGHDTKIYRNIAVTPHKVSNLERKASRMTLLIWLIQVVLCFATALYNLTSFWSNTSADIPYLPKYTDNDTGPGIFFISFFSWIAISATFIPISATVTLNIIRLIQGFFIQADSEMYYDELDMYAKARTTTLNEELGQVHYIFSDKTGTLTSNKMEFRKFAVAGRSYGKGYTDVIRSVYEKQGIELDPEPFNPNYTRDSNVNLVDDDLFEHLQDINNPRHYHLVEFFIHLACNNSVVTDVNENNEVVYASNSPDELCFVHAAKFAGFKLVTRTATAIKLSVFGKLYNVRILALAEFDYKRKCSSSILAFPLDPATPLDDPDLSKFRLVLFCKGGDNIIKEKLKNISPADEVTISHCKEYSIGGLRTLLFAKRDLGLAEYMEWSKKYQKAQANILKRDEEITKCMVEIEVDLELQGASGTEDKLQDGVPMTIERLTDAGIKIWMLTGDNLETSINIGIATNLLPMSSDRINLDSITCPLDTLVTVMKDHVKRITAEKDTARHRCVILDGVAVEELMKEELDNEFLALFSLCHTVICCRMTPYLKGTIVSFVKNKMKKITLAIGDGANDCNMIQTADVGVGLKGKEGVQAFNTSDFGLGQFRFLVPLLLNHGRCCYRRVAKSVLYMFYKNIALIIPVFLYGYTSFFSGQKFYYSILLSLYNLFFTSLPVIVLGAVDKDLKKQHCYKYPYIYQLGQRDYYLNLKVFLGWLLTSVMHGSLSFFILNAGLSDRFTAAFGHGYVTDNPIMSSSLMFIVILIVSIKLLLETWYYNVLTLTHFMSIFSYILTVFALSCSPTLGGLFVGSAFQMFTNIRLWIVTFTCVCAALYRDYCYKVILYSFAPHYYQQVQIVEYLKHSAEGENN